MPKCLPFLQLASLRARWQLLKAIEGGWERFRTAHRPSGESSPHCAPLEMAAAVWRSGTRAELRAQRRQLAKWTASLTPKARWRQSLDLLGSILIAGLGAVAIRSSWFELYYVPTGSMRPTICESDRLIVTKTAFGLNRPLSRRPLSFDERLLERGQIVTFTSEGIDMAGKTLHFGLFPGYRRIVKRLWAKGGDRVYFYGGGIYLLDSAGRTHILPRQTPALGDLEVIPFTDLRGNWRKKVDRTGKARLSLKFLGESVEHIDTKTPSPWGYDHFAQVGLLPSQQVPPHVRQRWPDNVEWWLEMYHHPRWRWTSAPYQSTTPPSPQLASLSRSYLPLHPPQLELLQSGLYTARFRVRDHIARRIDEGSSRGVFLSGVPDGDYEFHRGRVYQIGLGGNARQLPTDHPLASGVNFERLFDAGIDFSPDQLPQAGKARALPRRFAYFRDGALVVMNRAILSPDHPQLRRYLEVERALTGWYPDHSPFLDEGGPVLCDGQLEPDWMRKNGLLIPPGKVLLLGDNHARSGDSREFGLVDATNIQGTPLLTFWPPSSVRKSLHRPRPPHLTRYRLTVWSLAVAGTIAFYSWRFWKLRRIASQRPWRRLDLVGEQVLKSTP